MWANRFLPYLAEAEGSSNGESLSLGEHLERYVTWGTVFEILATVIAAYMVGWIFKRYVLVRVQRLAAQTDNDIDDRLVYFLNRFYKGIIGFIVLLVILKILRIELTPLLAGAGIVGIAVAYASKDIIGNFLSGVFLLVDRPIKIGDRIRIERIGDQWGSWGDVIDVGLRTTTVRNTDGVFVTYPNAKLAESVIKNFSPEDRKVRFRVRILVDYGTDLEQALSTMVDVATEDETVLDDPAPGAVVRSLLDESAGHMGGGALLELRCFVEDIRIRTKLRSKLLIEIKRRFDEEGIELARMELRQRRAA